MRAVLTYHSIENGRLPICVSPSLFREHIHAIQVGGYEVVGLEALLRRRPGAPPALAITFDDAFANFADIAAPALLAASYPATLFAVTDYLGRTNDWPGQAPGFGGRQLLAWRQLSDLQRAGFAVGAHTRTHPSLSRLEPPAAADEIAGSVDLLEQRLGCSVCTFAYPCGDAPDNAAALLRERQLVGVTTHLDYLRGPTDAARVPRLDAYYFSDPARLARLFEPATRRWIALRRTLRRVRGRIPL